MPLPLTTAKATKNMPGHYGHGTKKTAGKKTAAKKPAAKGKKGLPPALAKKAAEMKAKAAKKKKSAKK